MTKRFVIARHSKHENNKLTSEGVRLAVAQGDIIQLGLPDLLLHSCEPRTKETGEFLIGHDFAMVPAVVISSLAPPEDDARMRCIIKAYEALGNNSIKKYVEFDPSVNAALRSYADEAFSEITSQIAKVENSDDVYIVSHGILTQALVRIILEGANILHKRNIEKDVLREAACYEILFQDDRFVEIYFHDQPKI